MRETTRLFLRLFWGGGKGDIVIMNYLSGQLSPDGKRINAKGCETRYD